MTAYKLDDLISQAESGGVTLAEVMSSKLSANDLERMQHELGQMMVDNYRSIETFMADVEVPSIADLSDLSDEDLDEIQGEIKAALSDEAVAMY